MGIKHTGVVSISNGLGVNEIQVYREDLAYGPLQRSRHSGGGRGSRSSPSFEELLEEELRNPPKKLIF